jgi:hypothetical protein
MSVNEKMTAIANEVRSLSGTTDKLGLDAMAEHIQEANAEVGTHEDLIQQIQTALIGKTAGGGAPSGTLAWASGSFVLDADVSSMFYIPHGLGRVPNFYVLYTEDEVASVAEYKGYIHNITYVQDTVEHSSGVRYGQIYSNYGGSSIFSNSSAQLTKEECTETDLYINAASTRKLKAGKKYCWVCGVIAGM